MEGNRVKFDSIGEKNHCTENAVGKTRSLGSSSLTFIFKEVWKAFETHDLDETKNEVISARSIHENYGKVITICSPGFLQHRRMPPSN